MSSRTALLLVAHGSRREASNREVARLTDRLRKQAAGRYQAVACAFLGLAEPTVPAGIEACIAAGADCVIVLPCFLSAGRHVSEDIPGLVAASQAAHPEARIRLASHLGSAEDIAGQLLALADLALE